MESRLIKTTCCIAGGGPAGILLGYLLARAGIEVTVFEMWPDFFRDFRGDTIHPSTMDILAELGLLDEFLKLPHSEMTRMTMHVGGRTITMANLEHVKARCKFIAFIPQWDFLKFLSAKAKEFPSFHLMMETKATDLIKENGRVVGIRAEDKQGKFEIRADLVVGADGRHSTIREKGGFAVEELGVPIDVLWFRIGRSDADDKQSLGYLESGRALVMLDRHDYWQCGLIIPKGGFDAIKAAGLEAFRASTAKLAHLPASVTAEIDSWDKVKLLSVTVDHVKRWAAEGVTVIGDAAHAMSPIGGVGINYAIQDAVAAANILVPAFRNNEVSLATLDKIQARRERPARRMQNLQVYIQDRVFSPLLHEKNRTKGPWFFNLFAWFPILQRIPGNIIGMGFQPEHISPTIFAPFHTQRTSKSRARARKRESER
jgi:2-polyprenyl-6-methoxyphenol hydroxylase-like FAD-dependent oxidoreductase